jgi:3-oxocholest-4-en-26-oate---CoA ligase
MHGAGQWGSFQVLHAGGTVVVPRVVDRFDPDDVIDTIEAEQVNVLLIAGEAFARPLLEALEDLRPQLPSLVMIASTGAAFSPDSKKAILTHLPTARIRDTIGSSETGTQAETISREGDSDPTFRPAAGTFVVDENLTHIVEPGHEGTGWLARAGRIPLGYLNDREGTQKTFPVIAGTRMSIPGDRARMRADGTVELRGRNAAIINSGGEKIFAEEVEAAMRMHPSVRDVVVVGRPSERWGSEVVAVVQLDPGAELNEPELVNSCAATLARYKLPKAVIQVDKVVRSPSGKADYSWARELVARGT